MEKTEEYYIYNLRTYPQTGEFQEAIGYDIPLKLTKGEDFSHPNKRKLWAVYPNHKTIAREFLMFFWKHSTDEVRYFKTPEKAFVFMKKVYVQWLESEVKKYKMK